MLRIIITIILSGLATTAFSKLIDRLYSRETTDLSFPEQIKKRALLRRPLLFAGCAAAFFYFDPAQPIAGLLNLCFYLSLLIISVTDWEQYVIFDSVVLFFAAAGLLHSLLAGCLPEYTASLAGLHAVPPPLPLNALLTGAAAGVIMLLLAVLMKGSIFGGDIKLLAAVGIWLGSRYTPAAAALGFMLGGAAALFLLIATRKKRTDYFAYGPYFAIAAAIIRATGITLQH